MLAPVTKQALRLSASKVYLKASASDFQDHTLQFMHWAHESFSFSIRGRLMVPSPLQNKSANFSRENRPYRHQQNV